MIDMNDETLKYDIDQYIERYCQKHKVTPEEAVTHKIVKEVINHYEIRFRGGI